ncbi:MAG: putative MFS-type transporter YbfB [Candidatus Tectimicrobiota bacterium]|nr:MAG: putative MFS-type transporter YbfB [Candidatus Tectomicrobia bacterium]
MTSSTQSRDGQRWVILAAAFVIVFMTVGTRSTLGNFFKAIIADLQWDRGTISFIVAVNIWLSGLLQPFTGHLMDRFGAKWLFTGSVAAFGLGVLLISLTQSVWYLLVVYGLVMAAATAGASITLTNALVARWFTQRRGLAIGFTNAGSALGQLSLVYISYLLLSAFGWRLSHVYLGLAILIVALPMALLIPRRTARGDGVAGAAGTSRVRAPLETQSWRQALRSLPLWQINGGYFVCGMTVALYYTHLIPLATDRGFSPATAAATFSVLAAASAFGSLLGGGLSDRLGRKNVLALAYFTRAVAFALLLVWRHELALYAFALLGGVSWLATPPSVMALTGEIYGMRALGTLGGISLLAHQIGGGLSVWLAGVLFDLTGSYDISLLLAVLALLGASATSFSIAERRYSVRYLTSTAPVG